MKNMHELFNGDCLKIMDELINKGVKVDAIITDPPYGTTACKWDTIIPFEDMWDRLNKLVKDDGVVILFGAEPFSSALRMSNIKNFKYDWIWDKQTGVGHMVAKKRPLQQYEIISVFYNKATTYNPQMELRDKPIVGKEGKRTELVGGKQKEGYSKVYTHKYPKNIISISSKKNELSSKNRVHPTQKPIELMEYLIKTYTNEGEIVLDFTMGSGSTGVACINTKRKFIGIELDENYFNIAKDRIENVSINKVID